MMSTVALRRDGRSTGCRFGRLGQPRHVLSGLPGQLLAGVNHVGVVANNALIGLGQILVVLGAVIAEAPPLCDTGQGVALLHRVLVGGDSYISNPSVSVVLPGLRTRLADRRNLQA